MTEANQPPPTVPRILLAFLRLGLTGFGGPAAHLGHFRQDLVVRRRWLDERTYGELVSLCQFLPGPASSQLGMAIGHLHRGLPGSLAAWLGFTLPSAVAMAGFALLVGQASGDLSGAVHGLKVAAVAVVALALWGMGRGLCPDVRRQAIAAGACLGLSLFPGVLAQVLVLLGGALAGRLFLPLPSVVPSPLLPPRGSRLAGLGWLAALGLLLAGLPLLAAHLASPGLSLAAFLLRTGSLVFGGGHVVLPLLQEGVVGSGHLDTSTFLAGYGFAQAVPGPLFSLASFVGAADRLGPGGPAGAALATVAIFLPSFLLVWAALPWWDALRRRPGLQRALAGTNAATVGLLLSAFLGPVRSAGITSPRDLGLALVALLLLGPLRRPAWLVTGLCALAGTLGRP